MYSGGDVSNGADVVQIRFKDDGRYISITKGAKLTKSDVSALIKEAHKRNRIVDLSGK